MADDTGILFDEEHRVNWVRLRTLVALGWIAIFGQLVALVVADQAFDLKLDLGGISVVLGASIILNVAVTYIFPDNARLSERGAIAILIFDIAQLSAMLYLSGGLHNPFGVLILAPVSIAASALRPLPSIVTGAVAITLVTLIAIWYVPLETKAGEVLTVPSLFLFGHWLAIVIGIMFTGVFAWKVASEVHTMSEALVATQMALSREQKLTDIGGVVAAAAHELGTPLATIKLVSAELADELEDHEHLREDATLINAQADRCRDILRSMGQAGKDDLHMRFAPLQAVVEEASAPHTSRGVTVRIDVRNDDDIPQPYVYRRPDIIHGLRNLVQNAVDFAQTTVWIDVGWTDQHITLRIIDDGPGFPPSVLGRIGDPFLRRRKPERDDGARPGYEGMGLGLFIAKTLLERSGAEIHFANAADRYDQALHAGRRSGAIVELAWLKDSIAVPPGLENMALGENEPLEG